MAPCVRFMSNAETRFGHFGIQVCAKDVVDSAVNAELALSEIESEGLAAQLIVAY